MQHEQAVQNLAVEGYLLGDMSPGEREQFEEHFFECETCAEEVRAASQFLEHTRTVLAEDRARAAHAAVLRTPPPSPKRSAPSWLAWLQPQVAALAMGVLLVMVGFETFVTIPSLENELRETAAPRLMDAAVLRPQTRGQPRVLQAKAGQPALLLFDLPEDPAGSIQAVVESADGRVVLETPPEQPEGGEQVGLAIPRLDLPPGMYNLIVRSVPGSGSNGAELGRYPLQLQRR